MKPIPPPNLHKSTFRFRLLVFFAVLFVGLSLSYPMEISAFSGSSSIPDTEIYLKTIDSSNLTLSNPELHVTLEIGDSFESPINLSLSYLHFFKSDQSGQWAADDRFNSSFIKMDMGLYELDLEAEKSTVYNSLSIPQHIVAKLKKHPAIIVGQLVQKDGQPVGNSAIALSLNQELDLVHVSALAFDNPMYSAGNLGPQIRGTVSGIQEASAQKPGVLSVVLADTYGDDNSGIYFVYDGEIIAADSLFAGLPDVDGAIADSITEYDMGDGDMLGGFLKWVGNFTGHQRMSFSYYGHGSAIMPKVKAEKGESADQQEVDQGSGPLTLPSWVHVQPSWVHVQPSWVHVQPSWVHVQPSWVHVQPSWVHVQPAWVIEEEHFATDSHPLSLISVKDIARAAQLGSNNGEYPLAVLDLVHCFSLSIEQVHELAPYVDSIIGSANYHFYDARMPGQALSALEPANGSLQLADSIMQSYDRTLPQSGYPRTMAVIDGSQVADIKAHWDQTSAEIMNAFSQDHAATRKKLNTAYQNATKYDSTSCDNEFSLKSPDALVDFYELSTQVETQFAGNTSLTEAAHLTSSQIDAAVYSTINNSGNPWFGTSEADHWNFSGKGLSIFADLQGIPDPNSQSVALSWQTAFYNRNPDQINLNPFEFLISESDSPTWADVIQQSWDGYEVYPQSCLITIPPDHDEAEVAVINTGLVGNRSAIDNPNSGRKIFADITTDAPLGNVIIQIEVIQNNNAIYHEIIYTGWLEAGAHTIETPDSISEEILDTSSEIEKFIQITVDPDGYLIEASKEDNQLTQKIKR